MDSPPQDTREQPDYLSYLLRLWRVSEKETDWRASLESSHTGEREGFASLDDLFRFLREQTGVMSGASADEIENSAIGTSHITGPIPIDERR